MRLALVLAVLLWAPVGAQEIDPYNLPDGSLYTLEQPEITVRMHWGFRRAGEAIVFAGSAIVIRSRRCEAGVLWYQATWLAPRTLDRSRHIEGWIRASDIQEGGLSHFDSLRMPVGPSTPCARQSRR